MNWWTAFLNWFKPKPAPAPKPKPSPAPTPVPKPTPGLKYTSQVLPIEPFSASDLAAMHNIERQKAGVLPLLLLDTRLMAKADQRAELADHSHLAVEHLHDGFTITPGDALDGENAAIGAADAAGVMKGWMESPGHRANILDKRYTRVGFGRAITEDLITYIYAEFAG